MSEMIGGVVPGGSAARTESGGVSVVSAVGLRVCLCVMVALTAWSGWYFVRAERMDTPPLMEVLLLGELPLLVALYLSVNRKNATRMACAAGIAFAEGVYAVLVAPLTVIDTGFGIWDTGKVYKNLVGLQSLQPVMFVAGIVLCVFAWKCSRKRKGTAFLCIAVMIGYGAVCGTVYGKTYRVGTGSQKEAAAWEHPWEEAYRAMTEIAGCLIRHDLEHPEAGFPRSLSEITPEWGCEPKYMKPQPVSEYVFRYEAKRDAGSGKVTDFRLTAVPFHGDLVGPSVPLRMDKTGVMYAYAQWTAKGDHAYLMAKSGSALPTLQSLANKYRSENGRRVPESFRDFPGLENWWPRHIEGDGKTIWMDGVYDYVYKVGGTGAPGKYTMSAICKGYAHFCVLSYFLDEEGVVHKTKERRPATEKDEKLSGCEMDFRECMDIDWAVPDEPSGMEAMIAKVRHELGVTEVW